MSEKETTQPDTETTSDTREIYEISYLLVSSLSDEKVEEKATAIKDAIQKKGGELVSEGAPKMQPLAYTIEIPRTVPREKYDHAYFGWVKFELESSELSALQEMMKTDKSVIRFLAVKTVREDTLATSSNSKKEESKAESDDASDEHTDKGDDDPSAAGEDKGKDKDDLDKSIDELVVS